MLSEIPKRIIPQPNIEKIIFIGLDTSNVISSVMIKSNMPGIIIKNTVKNNVMVGLPFRCFFSFGIFAYKTAEIQCLFSHYKPAIFFVHALFY